jgi:YHS domain-containing protein
MQKLLGMLVIVAGLSTPLFAQSSEVYSTAKGAIRGYDPVAYFTVGKPVMGKKDFVYSWKGADWYFSSSENRASFQASPEKYAPQYGGYCAYGTAKGYKAPIDPAAWTIVDNKLYLNYNKEVQDTWNKDQPGYITTADKNWPEVKKKK